MIESASKLSLILQQKVLGNAKRKYGEVLPSQVKERLNQELAIFTKADYVDFVLFLETKILELKQKYLVIPQLFAGNSLVFYLLGITNVNPIEEDISFDLFENQINKRGLRLRFAYSGDDVLKYVKNNSLEIEPNDELKIAMNIGLTNEDISRVIDDPFKVVKYIDNDIYRKEFKKIDYCSHNVFSGIEDLNSAYLADINSEIPIKSYSDFVKAIALLHGSNAFNSNREYLLDYKNPNWNDLLCTRECMYKYLLDKNIKKENAYKYSLSHPKTVDEKELFLGEQEKLDSSFKDFYKNCYYLLPKAHASAFAKVHLQLAKVFLYEPERYYEAYFKINSYRVNEHTFSLNHNQIIDLAIKSRNYDEDFVNALLDMQERHINIRKCSYMSTK